MFEAPVALWKAFLEMICLKIHEDISHSKIWSVNDYTMTKNVVDSKKKKKLRIKKKKIKQTQEHCLDTPL